MKKYKMAIVGPRETVQGFEALGIEACNASSSEEATKKLFELKKEMSKDGDEEYNKYAVIYVLEELARGISTEDYAKLTKDALPSVITLPGTGGSTGYGEKRIGQMVEKAVGQNILGE